MKEHARHSASVLSVVALWFLGEPGDSRWQGLGDAIVEGLVPHSKDSGLDRGGNVEPGGGLASGDGLGG